MNNDFAYTLIVNEKSSGYNQKVIRACREVFIANDIDIDIKTIPSKIPCEYTFETYFKNLVVNAFSNERIPISVGGDGSFSMLQHVTYELMQEGFFDQLAYQLQKQHNEKIKEDSLSIVSHIGIGTANDMIKNLGLPKKPTDQVKAIIDGTIKKRDIVLINDNPMGYSAVVGLASHVPPTTHPFFKKFKKPGYFISGILDSFINKERFWDPVNHPYLLKLYNPNTEKVLLKEGILLAIVNGKKFAGLNALPNDEMDDGLFNIIIADNLYDFGAKLGECFFANDVSNTIKTGSMDIDFTLNTPLVDIDMDGDSAPFLLGENKHLKVRVAEKQLQLRIPK